MRRESGFDKYIPQIRNPEPDALGQWHMFHSTKFLQKTQYNQKEEKLVTNEAMSSLGIPPFLQHSYLNGMPPPAINCLRQWQNELFSKTVWRARKSVVVLAPTSGGKTMVAEVAFGQDLFRNPDSKHIYALPFVSLASEKTIEFRKRFFKHNVRPFYQNIGGNDFKRGSIAICTYEKAHSILNSCMKEGYISKIQTIVIDEIHMIGDENRGPVVESLIMKCLLLCSKHNIRIICLSATLCINDAERIATWINGFTYICQTRPSRIKHYYLSKTGNLFLLDSGQKSYVQTIPSSSNKSIIFLIRSLLSKKAANTVLVFVNTRNQTQQVAEFIANHIYDEDEGLPKINIPDDYVLSERIQIIQKLSKSNAGLDPSLKNCIACGVGYHNAGMLLEERNLIEEALRNGTISVIVATTTLSAGINIRNVSRVIINDIYRYKYGVGKIIIPHSQYIQMAGRAGRDENNGGDVIIIGQNEEAKEINDSISLSTKTLDTIKSYLIEESSEERYFLQCLVMGFIESKDNGINLFYRSKLDGLNLKEEEIRNYGTSLVERLKRKGLIENEYTATDFGKAIAESSLSVEEGIDLRNSIKRAENGLNLEDEVHMLYLCVPASAVSSEKTPNYEEIIWQKLINEHENVIKLIASIDSMTFQKHIILTAFQGGKGKTKDLERIDKELDKVYYACLLKNLIDEHPIFEIVKQFNISRGAVQAIQMQAANHAGQTAKFCERIHCYLLSTAILAFRKRLDFCVHADLIPLLRLPSCTKSIARFLHNSNIKNPSDVCNSSNEQLASIFLKNGFTENESNFLSQKIKEESIRLTKTFSFLESIEELSIHSFLLTSNGVTIL